MPGPSVSQPLVVPSACRQLQDTAGVADGEGADLAVHCPGDHLPGGFVLGLADPAGVPGLHGPVPAPVLPPPPRPPLPPFRGAARHRAVPVPGVAQVLPGLCAHRPPRHQELLPLRVGDLAVLRFLPSHLINQEIAEPLFLPINPMKTHLRSAYRKLGATSRRDAIARSRCLDLL